MSITKNLILKCFCLLLLLSSFSSVKKTVAIGFSDSENDVWHSLTSEKIGMPWMDIINVYTYGASIVIECIDPIPIEDPIPIDFLVLFSNDNDETNWEAAIHVYSHGSGNQTANWVIGNLEELTVYDWNFDPIGTHFSFLENVLTLFFTEFEDVSTSMLSVVTTAKLEDEITREVFLLKDWAPDYYQPQDFKTPFINDTTTQPTSTTTTVTRNASSTTITSHTESYTNESVLTTPSVTKISLFPIILSILVIIYSYRRRKGL